MLKIKVLKKKIGKFKKSVKKSKGKNQRYKK